METTILLWSGWALAAALAVASLPLIATQIFPRRLASSPMEIPGGGEWPEVTVVVPSRNEAEAVRLAAESLLALDYPALRVVAVDDRSGDGTGAILDDLAARDPRLEVVHIRDLPAGWLGKNHANWIGAARTRSPWILFTDGDIVLHPEALRRAIAHALRERIDHLTLALEFERGGIWESAMISAFALVFGIRFQPWLARTRLKGFFIGIGAFNLISRAAYDAIGTHRRLQLEVADDMKLGKLVKVHGLRQDILDGNGMVRVRWQVGMRGVIRGLEKNAFSGFDFSLAAAVIGSILYIIGFLLPYPAAALAPGASRWGFVAALLVLHAGYAATVWRNRQPLWAALLLPAALVIFLYTIWRSIVLTLRRGGVVWRDTFYPIDDLRRGVV